MLLSPNEILISKKLTWLNILPEDLRKHVKFFDIEYNIHYSCLILNLFILNDESRYKGIGSKIIQILILYCRNHCLNLLLMPDDKYGTPIEILDNFYLKNGGIKQNDGYFLFI